MQKRCGRCVRHAARHSPPRHFSPQAACRPTEPLRPTSTRHRGAIPVTLANADTTTLRDVNLFLRCNDRFAEDSLTVHIRVRTPDSLQHEEPFVMVIPPAHTPAAISREADIPYRRRVRFDRTGDYHLTITPCRPVEGIEAVGIHIVKSQ